jgi:hypothetical protein
MFIAPTVVCVPRSGGAKWLALYAFVFSLRLCAKPPQLFLAKAQRKYLRKLRIKIGFR